MRTIRGVALPVGATLAIAAACGSRTSLDVRPVFDAMAPEGGPSSSSSGASGDDSSGGGSSSGTVPEASFGQDAAEVHDAFVDTSCPSGESFCDGVCVNEQTDPNDCGGCDDECGGTCTDGRCLVSLAATPNPPWAIAVDSNNVYWTVNGPGIGLVLEVPIDGGTPLTLAASDQEAPWAIAVDGKNVYWANEALFADSGAPLAGSVLQTPVGGGQLLTLASPFESSGIAVSQGIVYGTQSEPQMQLGGVASEPVGGGAVTTIASQPLAAYALAVENGSIYWSDPNEQWFLTTPIGGGPVVTISAGNPTGEYLAVDATNIYFGDALRPAGHVMSVPIAGGPVVTLASQQSAPWGVASDGTNVYWSNDGDVGNGSIVRMPVGGGTPTTLVSGRNSPLDLAIDATSVYWVEQSNVMKLTPR